MTFDRLLMGLTNGSLKPAEAKEELMQPEKKKKIRYYSHLNLNALHPLKDAQLAELRAIVEILQILENTEVGSPVTDMEYDNMQELLVSMGIPRLTGTVEINDAIKVSHTYTSLRGTLGKVYYLSKDEPRTNKSRKYLYEWIERMERRYQERTGKSIHLGDQMVLVQPKFDGVSCVLEVQNRTCTWITRGDTRNNRASDVSNIMRPFQDAFVHDSNCGIKFEVMVTEENKETINKMLKDGYKNSRQLVTATINANEPDFKVDYLYPVPLRIIYPNQKIEQIHPQLIEKFPTMQCRLNEVEKIREFANKNRYVDLHGVRLRTDGAVMTILDPEIQEALGRENDINLFEVAYKFTEEAGYSKVKGIEFYVSEFGHITPVLVVHDVILKGNTINHISLANKERFDELGLCYGDEVKVLYDIIPYVTVDEKCRRGSGRLIPFTPVCPKCGEPLDLDQVEVQCNNPKCMSRILGRILNYCDVLRIKNIGYSTLETLYLYDFLPHGIRSLYRLKKHSFDIQMLDGFGKIRTKKLIAEIEAKRRLDDYQFFGALGIEGLSTKTFQMIFQNISLEEFLNMIKLKNYSLLKAKLVAIKGIGDSKADLLVQYVKNGPNKKDLLKLLDEVILRATYGRSAWKGRVVFSGCRPSAEDREKLQSLGYEASDSWSKQAKLLVIPYENFESDKRTKAEAANIPIVLLSSLRSQSLPI